MMIKCSLFVIALCLGLAAATIPELRMQDSNGTCIISKLADGSLSSDCTVVAADLRIGDTLQVGNSIQNLWGGDLPSGVDHIRTTPDGRCCGGTYGDGGCTEIPGGCGYATGKLHMKTNMLCANTDNAMYHLEFRGHLFKAQKAFFCEAVGYLAAAGLTHSSAACHVNPSEIYHPMSLREYCTTDGFLAFALNDPSHQENLWHASDIVVNYIGGSGNYIARGNQMRITDTVISPNDDEWCANGAYCLLVTEPVMTGCVKPSGWVRPYGDVAISAAGAESCKAQCKAGGYMYYGLECPMGSAVHCQCHGDSSLGVTYGDEYCEGTGNPLVHTHDHCVGPYIADGYRFGDYTVGSVYLTN